MKQTLLSLIAVAFLVECRAQTEGKIELLGTNEFHFTNIIADKSWLTLPTNLMPYAVSLGGTSNREIFMIHNLKPNPPARWGDFNLDLTATNLEILTPFKPVIAGKTNGLYRIHFTE